MSPLTSSHIRATPVTEVLQGSWDLTCSRVHRGRDKSPPMLKLRSSTVFTSPKKQEKISCCKRLAETWPRGPLRGRWERMSLDRRSCDILQQGMPRDKGLDTGDQRRMWGTASSSQTLRLASSDVSDYQRLVQSCRDARIPGSSTCCTPISSEPRDPRQPEMETIPRGSRPRTIKLPRYTFQMISPDSLAFAPETQFCAKLNNGIFFLNLFFLSW